MGGGAAMRAAAKVAGVGVVNTGIRGGSSAIPSPAEQTMRNASRPVSAILSSSLNGKAGAVDMEGVQRPAWEIDDWEFAGFEEDQQFLESIEPKPRVVFGPAPTLQEAKDATSDLKDALEKNQPGGPFGGDQLSALSLLANSDHLETKSCITYDARALSKPKYAVKAFELLNKSPEVQNVVACIASDPQVWSAVLQNEALQGFIESQKTKSGVDADFQDLKSPRFTETSDDTSQDGNTKNSPMDMLENIKHTVFKMVKNVSPRFTKSSDDTSQDGNTQKSRMDILENIKDTVVEMANNVSNFVQHIFSFSAENSSAAAEKNSQQSFFNNTLGASFMGMAIMVIIMVVLKRG